MKTDQTDTRIDTGKGLSVVIPLLDEAETLPELVNRIKKQAEFLFGTSFEIILIDDGSTDESWSVIEKLYQEGEGRIKACRHRRNFGKAAALAHGFEIAEGRVVVTMDADLQDQPEELPKFIGALDKGYDLVSGWKKDRKDPISKTFPSKVFNLASRAISGVQLHDMNCGFKAYRQSVVKSLRLYGEMHRFIPILAAAEGFSIGEVEIEHKRREFGHSKYGVGRFFKGSLDLLSAVVLTRYLKRPAHFFGGLGIVAAIIGVGILTYLSIGWFMGYKGIGTRPLFFFGILSTLLSAQLISLGVLAEFILFQGSNERKPWEIEELLK